MTKAADWLSPSTRRRSGIDDAVGVGLALDPERALSQRLADDLRPAVKA